MPAYPELLPPALAERWLYPDGDSPAELLRTALTDGRGRRADATVARRHLERLSWPNIIGVYDEALATVRRSAGQPETSSSSGVRN